MRFIDKLPTTVDIEGVEFPINWDFRTSIRFEMMVQEEVDERNMLLNLLELYYGDKVPNNISKAIEMALWFYSGGEAQQKKSTVGNKDERPYSFDYDWGYIYSAFLEQFHVDLQDVNIHWWKFRSMFSSLGENTKFAEIIGYRCIKITNKIPKEQREFYRRMKKIYALPKSKKEESRINDIRERLRNGESIESIFDTQRSDYY